MKNTPLDYLLHDAVTNQHRHPVYAEFFKLLTTHPIKSYHWPEWGGEGVPKHLPGDVGGDVFGPDAPCFCLFSDVPVNGVAYHAPCITTEIEGMEAIWPGAFTWILSSVLVYRLDKDNFDVIGVLRDLANLHLLPELQLRFTRIDGRWSWAKASTGFINPYVYAPALAMIKGETDALDDAINYYGNLLSTYLGGYHAWLSQPGAWHNVPPAEGRVKYDKKRRIKKFYRLPSSGYQRFKPEHNDAETKICDSRATG